MNTSEIADPTKPGSNGETRAGSWLGRAGGKLDQARQPVADKLHGTAEALREQAQTLFEQETISETVADFAQGAADRIASSADYLESRDVAQIAGDMGAIVRRNPVPALLIAATLGFLFGRAFRRG